LTDESLPAGTQRNAYSHFPFPSLASYQQQVGDVGTGNQEHKADGCKKQIQSLFPPAEQALLQRINSDSHTFVDFGKDLGQMKGRDIHRGLSLLNRNAWLQFSDANQESGIIETGVCGICQAAE